MKSKPKKLSPIQMARRRLPHPTPETNEAAGCRGSLKPIGTKGERKNQWYDREKRLHLKKYPYCALCLKDGVRNKDVHIHHKAGRKGALLWHRDYFLTLCHHHHRWVHDNVSQSLTEGLLIHLDKADEDRINGEYRKLGMF